MHDLDPSETKEWLDALDSIRRAQGDDRASYILDAYILTLLIIEYSYLSRLLPLTEIRFRLTKRK